MLQSHFVDMNSAFKNGIRGLSLVVGAPKCPINVDNDASEVEDFVNALEAHLQKVHRHFTQRAGYTKPDLAREFISPILHQLVHNPPDSVSRINSDSSSSRFDSNIDVFNDSHEHLRSRDRSVFAVLIRIYSRHPRLLSELTKVIRFMCMLQPP